MLGKVFVKQGDEQLPQGVFINVIINNNTSTAPINIGRVYFVGSGTGDKWYKTVNEAVAAINQDGAPAFNDRAVIVLTAETHTIASPVAMPQWTALQGMGKGETNLVGHTTDLFTCNHNNWFSDFTVDGSAIEGIVCFDGNNKSALHIRRVDLLNNGGQSKQLFLKQSGPDWKILFIEDCIIDSNISNGYFIDLINTSSATRQNDVIINNAFIDNWTLSNYGGAIHLWSCNDIRIKRSTIRGQSQYWTGIRHVTDASGPSELQAYHCEFKSYSSNGYSIYGGSNTSTTTGGVYGQAALFHGSHYPMSSIAG